MALKISTDEKFQEQIGGKKLSLIQMSDLVFSLPIFESSR